MYNRPDDAMYERSSLTDDYLSQCINELQNIITACQATIDGKSFSQACRDVNLDPQKTGSFLTGRLMNLSKIQTPVDKENSYDGYKHFYVYVFGEAKAAAMTLPPDYKQSVDYVLNNTGLSEEDSRLMQRRFGIGNYDRSARIRNIGKTAQERNMLNSDIARISNQCRSGERADILTHGLRTFEKTARKEEAERKLSATMKQTTPEEKRDIRNADPDELREYLRGIPVRELNLTQPAADSLKTSGIRSIYDAFSMTDEDIDRLPIRHDIFRSEIRTSREIYSAKNFGTNVSQMMDILSKNDDFTKAVESVGMMDTTMEQ